MTVITIVRSARCKDCIFAKEYHPLKKDGTPSKRTFTKCTNPKSPRSFTQIRQNDLVCDEWKLT